VFKTQKIIEALKNIVWAFDVQTDFFKIVIVQYKKHKCDIRGVKLVIFLTSKQEN